MSGQTTLASLTDADLGRAKVELAAIDPNRDYSSAEMERIKRRIVELSTIIGLGDGTTSGSLEERVADLEAGDGGSARTWKAACRAVKVTNQASLSGTLTVDGVALIANDRLLLTAQSTASQNGPWVIAAGAWTRPTDFDATADVAYGAAFVIREGTLYQETFWLLTTDGTITIGSTSLAISQFSPSVVAGTGISVTGTTVSADFGTGSGKVQQSTSAALIASFATLAASISVNSQKITSLADPVSAQDAATKTYVDALVQGLTWKQEVRVATTGAVTLATAFENGDTIDGVVLATGDRVLVKDQASGAENGIYTVNASGAPTRATDFDASADVAKGAAVFVQEGTANANTAWVMTTNETVSVGSTALVFAQLSGGTSYSAGNGLTLTSTTFAADFGTGTNKVQQATSAALIATAATLAASLGMNSQKITGLAAGTATGDAARYDEVNAIGFPAPVTDSSNARTLSNSDNGKLILCTRNGGITITVPDSLTVGFSCQFAVSGTGAGIVFAASGTQVLKKPAANDSKCSAAEASCGVIVFSSTRAQLMGNLDASGTGFAVS